MVYYGSMDNKTYIMITIAQMKYHCCVFIIETKQETQNENHTTQMDQQRPDTHFSFSFRKKNILSF